MAKSVTEWDLRAFARALGAALLALAVVWLVTAASDEGGLAASVRAGRILPVAPLCSAAAAVLALGTARVRQETHALEALGRSPAQTTRAVALGAAAPSLAIALVIALHPRVDVAAFYPRVTEGEQFVWEGTSFASPTLGMRFSLDGTVVPIDATAAPHPDANLPRFARLSAALSTALAGAGLALVAAEATLAASPRDRRARRRRSFLAAAVAVVSALLTLVAFQAAATRLVPAMLAFVPPAILFGATLAWRRSRYREADARR